MKMLLKSPVISFISPVILIKKNCILADMNRPEARYLIRHEQLEGVLTLVNPLNRFPVQSRIYMN